MSAFEFFFSFYGLLLGLSVAVIATGLATAIQHRRKIRIGWLTPMLALFVGLDIASFWDFAWSVFRDVPFNYGLLVVGLGIAIVYFVAASLVFPHAIEDGMSLDDHFWANKRTALLLTVAANVLAIATMFPAVMAQGGPMMMATYLFTLTVYVVIVVPAAFAKKPTLFAVLIGLHILIYLALGALSATQPHASDVMSAVHAETQAEKLKPASE